MSDLFTSLVDRALERAPVLQRRQPALFEPVAESVFAQPAQVVSDRSIQERDDFVERSQRPESERSEFKTEFSTFNRPSLDATETRAHESQIVPRQAMKTRPPLVKDEKGPRESPHLTTRTESPADRTVREEAASRSLVPHGSEKLEKLSVAPSRMIETIIEKREIISEPARNTKTASEAQTVDLPSAQTRKPVAEDNEKLEQPVKVKSEPLRPAKDELAIKPLSRKGPAQPPKVSPLIRAASRSNAARVIRHSAPPSIQVTIGRVEVRATPPPAPARSQPAPVNGPRMNLDDYLRSRSEGT